MTALTIAAFMLNFVPLSGHFELDGAECSDFHPEFKQYFLDNHPRHQITRRQAAGGDEMPTTTTTNAAQDTEYCDFVWSNVYCSSGAAQNSVTNYLRCGYNVTYVRSRFGTCARSEGGTVCGSVEFTSDMEQYLEGNCFEAVATNSNCCSLYHTQYSIYCSIINTSHLLPSKPSDFIQCWVCDKVTSLSFSLSPSFIRYQELS